MRKKLIMALLVVLVCTVAGCGNKNGDESEGDEENSVVEVTEVQIAQVPGADSSENADQTDEVDEVENVNEASAFFSSADLLWILPKSFRALDGEEGVYVSRDYPKDISTVTYVIAESDENISDVSQDEFREMMEADFLDAYGDQVSVNITNFEKIKLNRRSGLRIDMEYEFKGAEYIQIAIMLYNGDESHIINYTQEKDGKWTEEFENSISSLNFAD